MRLAIDVDGVIANFTASWAEMAIRIGNPKARVIPNEEIECWRWPQVQLGLTDEETNDVWEALKDAYNWWMTLRPLISPEEIDVLNGMIGEHDVYFITTRVRTLGLSAETQTRYWLESIGLHISKRAGVIATRAGTKGQLARGLDLDVALDDSPDNLWEYADAGLFSVARAWRYNWPWTPDVTNLHAFKLLIDRFGKEGRQ